MKNGVLSVHIENFKKIEFLNIDLQGRSVWAIGDNEVGKSSFLQAIFNLLSNQPFPDNSITDGKEAGIIETAFVIDSKKYTARRVFNAKYPKGRFELESEDGIKTEKVSVLLNLIGNISFDPFEFVEWSNTADGRRRQVALVRQLIPAEVDAKITEADALYQVNFNNRAKAAGELKDSKSYLGRFIVPDQDLITYAKPVEVEALQAESRQLLEFNDELKIYTAKASDYTKAVNETKTGIEKLEAALKTAKSNLKALVKNQQENEDLITEAKRRINPARLAEIEPLIAQAAQHNVRVADIKKYLAAREEVTQRAEKWAKLNDNCARCISQKQKLLNEAGLPVEGLSFDENGIYLNGLPVSEEQISTAQIMEIGVKIQTALNPKLRILRVPRAESLGKKRREAIVEYCKNNGFQLFAEKVNEQEPNLKIEFIEE